ncbi:c-type cytochrome [Kordiimonas aquimaris]|uniref:c-type cytochrome n=1 Tax=Kordiimonas aquimaris TaxID=707591 RepID=UPI00374DC885
MVALCNGFRVRMYVWTLLSGLFIVPQAFASIGNGAFADGAEVVELDADSYSAGEKLYGRCKGCHAFEYNRVGPKHCGLKGRRAGSLDGYRFSEAMKQSGIVWNVETLDRFLKSPTKVIPRTSMGYGGVKDDAERRLLVAYMLQESTSQERCADE